MVAGLLFGLIPVFKYASPKGSLALRGGGRSLSQSKERHRARNTLIIVQTALAVVLLIGAGLMIRTFQALRQVHPGFTAAAQLQTFRIDIADGQVKEPERVLRMQQEIRRKIAEIPGVSSVSFANSVPTDGNNSTDVLYAEDRVYAEGQVPPLRRFKFVTPGFFQTMGTPLIAGRDLTWQDVEQRRNVALVSENFARELWRSPAGAIGKRIREGAKDSWREIVGVVGDVRHDGADQKAPATIYWPVYMENFWGNEKFLQRSSVYAIRTDRAGSESLVTQIRQVVWSVVPEVPIVRVRTMEEVYRGSMARSSFTLVMLGIAGGMALLLGIVGHLWSDLIFRVAADAGIGNPYRAGRGQRGSKGDGGPAGRSAGGNRDRRGACGSGRRHASHVVLTVRDEGNRSDHVRGGFRGTARGRGDCKLPAGAPRFLGQSGGGTAGRIGNGRLRARG